MPSLTADYIWRLSNQELLDFLDSQPKSPFKIINFYAPSFMYYKSKHFCSSKVDFTTISVTGTFCALNCKHCGSKVLETMNVAQTPEQLFSLCSTLKSRGAKGCLISGGCLPDGSVPLDNFIPILGQIKRELNLTIFVHSGVISLETAKGLKNAGVDAVLLDVIGSEKTISNVLNLKVKPQSYSESLKALSKAKLNFVPHIIVGLDNGHLDGELEALKMIGTVKPSALVIIAFMPIRGTAMEKTAPPTALDIARVIATARLMLPDIPLVLGCMRSKGEIRKNLDVLALKAGVDAIAFPSEEAIDYAKKRGNKINFSSYCCAQIFAAF